MNNKWLHIAILLAFTFPSAAQSFGFNVWGGNYTAVHTYNGATSNDPIKFQIVCSCSPIVNFPNWKVSVRVKQIITDGTKVFPTEKLVMHPNSTSGNQVPYGMPSPAQIGMPMDVPLSLSEVFLVPQSNAALYNTSYYFESILHFNLQILPGAYLGDLQGGDTQRRYPVFLEFKFYNQNNVALATLPYKHDIDVYRLSGNPPVQNNFSLTVNGGAQNGTLTLQSRSDYDGGMSVTYAGGLTVNTNAAYQVTVNATSGTPYFAYGNNTIDLDVLNVNLANPPSGVTQLNTVTLSTGSQVLAWGNSTSNQNANFDVKYTINPNNRDKLLYAVKEQTGTTTYSTTLQYTILAQ